MIWQFVSSIGNSTTSIPRWAFLSFLSILLLVVHFPTPSLDQSDPVACNDFVEENAGFIEEEEEDDDDYDDNT